MTETEDLRRAAYALFAVEDFAKNPANKFDPMRIDAAVANYKNAEMRWIQAHPSAHPPKKRTMREQYDDEKFAVAMENRYAVRAARRTGRGDPMDMAFAGDTDEFSSESSTGWFKNLHIAMPWPSRTRVYQEQQTVRVEAAGAKAAAKEAKAKAVEIELAEAAALRQEREAAEKKALEERARSEAAAAEAQKKKEEEASALLVAAELAEKSAKHHAAAGEVEQEQKAVEAAILAGAAASTLLSSPAVTPSPLSSMAAPPPLRLPNGGTLSISQPLQAQFAAGQAPAAVQLRAAPGYASQPVQASRAPLAAGSGPARRMDYYEIQSTKAVAGAAVQMANMGVWVVIGAVLGGVTFYVLADDIKEFLDKHEFSIVMVGILVGIGTGALISTKLRIIPQGLSELGGMLPLFIS